MITVSRAHFSHLAQSDLLCLILFLLGPGFLYLYDTLTTRPFLTVQDSGPLLWLSSLHLVVSKHCPLLTTALDFSSPPSKAVPYSAACSLLGSPWAFFTGSVGCAVLSRAARIPEFPRFPLLALCQSPLRASFPAAHSIGREFLGED